MAKSGEGIPLIRGKREGSNPSAPTCLTHDELKVQVGARQHWKCRSCNREYQRTWFSSNREIQRARIKANSRKAKKSTYDAINQLKQDSGCVDCKESDPVVLDLDHRDRKLKVLGVSAMISRGYSLEKILIEVAKCDVRCANCHRRRTASQLGWYTSSS